MVQLSKKVTVACSVVVIGIVLYSVLAIWVAPAWYKHNYPYGSSHCCIKDFMLLGIYAHDHHGILPRGKSSPEASLSLLHHGEYSVSANTLRGKTVPLEVTQAALKDGGLLGPDSCGWHYVEGLTLADNPEIAVIWDKVGLSHNGKRLPNGGHEVYFLSNDSHIISGTEWPLFLKNQEALLAARTEREIKGVPALIVKIRLPSGQIVDSYDGPYSYCYSNGVTTSCVSRSARHSQALNLYRLHDGSVTIRLELGNWKSKQFEVEVSDGMAVPNQIILDMASQN